MTAEFPPIQLHSDLAAVRALLAAAELASADLEQWQIVRACGEQRRWLRILGQRFRQDPDAYLQALEEH